ASRAGFSPRPQERRSEWVEREPKVIPHGLQPHADEPPVPEGMDLSVLPVAVRAELKSLSGELAAQVGAHLMAAGELIDVDPAQALKHAHAARRRAARLTVTREALAEAAY